VARRLQKDGYGTGAAYTDVNGDGVLDVFISHGESSEQPLTFYSAATITVRIGDGCSKNAEATFRKCLALFALS
jgi:hypothetical protein